MVLLGTVHLKVILGTKNGSSMHHCKNTLLEPLFLIEPLFLESMQDLISKTVS